jgi:ABC-2 type transport system permease protein
MRLLGVELTRFRSRRAIVLILVAAALLTALLVVTTIWDTRPVSAADLAGAEETAQAEAQRPVYQRQLAQCERDPEQFFGPDATVEQCQEILPTAEWFTDRLPLSLEEQNGSTGTAVIVLVTGLMIVIGTTFAGADWASGSVSNQVLFEPRRPRVWAAKAGAVLLGTLAATAVILAAFWVTLYLVAESRGIATGAAVQEEIRWTAARGVLLAAGAAAGAYALTMLLRHTVGTLAVLFAYAVGGEILIATLPLEGIGRWSLYNNVAAWLRDGYTYYDPSLPCGPGAGHCTQAAFLSLGGAAAFLGGLVLVGGVLSLLHFRRRDIP